MVACCCGHNKYRPSIIVVAGGVYAEIFSGTEISKRVDINPRFYKKDDEGYYFIPEAIAKVNSI